MASFEIKRKILDTLTYWRDLLNTGGTISDSIVKTNKTWFGDDVYTATINIGTLPSSSTTTKIVAHGIVDIAQIVKIEAIAISSGTTINLPYASDPSSGGITTNIEIFANLTNIHIKTGTDLSAWTGYVTLEFIY